jgi:hypothetical protein
MPTNINTTVQLISAPWCKRCHLIKPEVKRYCEMAGAVLTELNFDELEEGDPLKATVKALPTIMMRLSAPSQDWVSYAPADLEKWKVAILALIPVVTDSEDF